MITLDSSLFDKVRIFSHELRKSQLTNDTHTHTHIYMSSIKKNNEKVHTDLSCLQIIVKSIHGVGQTVDVIEDFVVQGPIQTIGDVHLVKALFHVVVRKEGI